MLFKLFKSREEKYTLISSIYRDFPGDSVVKNPPRNTGAEETRVRSLDWEDPLEKEMAPHSSILAWRSHGQRSLVGSFLPFLFFFIGLQLLYSVVLVSVVQHHESDIGMCVYIYIYVCVCVYIYIYISHPS